MAIGWHAPNAHEFDITDRLFKTSYDADYESCPDVYRGDEDEQWLLIECPAGERCPDCDNRPGHYGCIVVAVDGACRNNGLDGARAAAAVYFHPRNDDYNSTFMIPGLQTSQRAELHAGLKALRLASKIKDQNPKFGEEESREMRVHDPLTFLLQVVIKTDFEYLVKGMTTWMAKWKRNGFLTARKSPVVNADLFKTIDRQVEALNTRGVQVQFWHVPRELNGMAD